ncbi:hypothetical protein [Mycobacterium sp.]|uniref:hypothetical protein n=1 Tax=Mycobacterium sp. TaxID=1785 RepID=UPI003D134240
MTEPCVLPDGEGRKILEHVEWTNPRSISDVYPPEITHQNQTWPDVHPIADDPPQATEQEVLQRTRGKCRHNNHERAT